MCNAHYFRWYRTGNPGPGVIADPRRTNQRCSAKGCGKAMVGRGYCMTHYSRLMRTGSHELAEQHPNWRGDDITYGGMHRRLRRRLGIASAHPCAGEGCDQMANDWAYDHADPQQKIGTSREGALRPYSTKLEHYRPLCHSHHTALDRQR
jgi:hypothetical protein